MSLCDKEKVFSEPADRKPDLHFEIRILDFTFEKSVPQGRFQFRNPNPDFMDFLLTVRLGNPKLKGFAKLFSQTAVFFLLIVRARARPLFLGTVSFKSLFGLPNRTVKRKSKNRFLSVEIRFWISRSFANSKSGF